MLEHLINIIVPEIAHLLEIIGVFIIFYSAMKTFGRYALRFFNFSDETVKIDFSQALAMALEFKLGAEILKTLVIRTTEELIILRAALTLIIHWEIDSDSKRCNNLAHHVGKKSIFHRKPEEDSTSN